MTYSIGCEVHTHTIVSGHAFGTIREMAQAAAEKGETLLGFAEHGPGIPGTCKPIYFGGYDSLPRELYGVELLGGSEINILNDGTLNLHERYLKYLHFGIAGIHGHCYHDEGREKNTDNVISCMENPKIFFVSHPDDDHTPLNYERLVLGAKENHVALELNNSSLRKPQVRLNCVENYKTMLSLCQRYGCPILVSTDAHDPSEVGDFRLAQALLEELHFDPELIVNRNKESLKAFLGLR